MTTTEELKKLYASVQIPKELGLPISPDIMEKIEEKEHALLEQTLFPKLKGWIEQETSNLYGEFHIALHRHKDGTIEIKPIEKMIQSAPDENVDNLPHYYTRRINSNSPIQQQFKEYLLAFKSAGTAQSYTSQLNSSVRYWIDKVMGPGYDSIYSFTTVKEVKNCIHQLKSNEGFVKANEQKHHSLSAPLDRYLDFILSIEYGTVKSPSEVTINKHTPSCYSRRINSNSPIQRQFKEYLLARKTAGTVQSYTSQLNSSVRYWIDKVMGPGYDSIYSFTTVREVRNCIRQLNSNEDFVKDNERRHHSLTAPLDRYLDFILSLEYGTGEK